MDAENNEGLSPEELAAIEGEDETQTDDLLAAVAGAGDEAGADVSSEGGEKSAGGEAGSEAGAETPPDGDAAEPGAAAPDGEGGDPDKEISGGGGEKPAGETPAAEEPVLTLPESATIEVPENIPQVRFQFRDDGQVLPGYQPRFVELDEKYESGDLPLSEYNEQRDALKAAMNNEKADAQLWQAECETFWRHNKDWRPGTPLFDMLNGEIMRLAQNEQAQGLSGIEIIYAAHKRVSEAVAALQPNGGAKPKEPAGNPAGKRPASPKPSAAAHALGTIPPAAPADVGQGEFAHLDNLEGLELEAAVAAMTPAQRDRWVKEN